MFVPFSRFRECAIKLYGQKHFRENFVKFGEAAYFGHIWAKNKFFRVIMEKIQKQAYSA